MDRIIVVDCDQGHSGKSTADREGFQKLVAEVGMGRAGIVLGLEVSRLARNNADWHRLLEICALAATLILDEDGLYAPATFNDRLLLGLKGTMSEAELHVMQARMRGGVLNKARRGELALPLPVGLVYNAESQVILDPDQQVQHSLQLLFATFRRTGTACATVRAFREQGLLFPRRPRGGPGKGELLWVEPTRSRVIQILRSPRYAGAFVYGRTRSRKKIDGAGRSSPVQQPREQWHTLLVPEYLCQQEGIACAEPPCQRISGAGIDAAIGQLLMEAVTPVALEVALVVQQELQSRRQEADRLRQTQVERARYEANLAQRRYLEVDPDNRLVADALEADWNEKLRALTDAQQQYERQRESDQRVIGADQRARILALATDFHQLRENATTPDRERKRMVRSILEDVTLIRQKEITVHIRFKGGANKTIRLPIPPTGGEKFKTSPEVVTEIDRLLDGCTAQRIADIFNAQSRFRPGKAGRFNRVMIGRIQKDYSLKSRYDRLREAGMLTCSELAQLLGISPQTVCRWRNQGRLRSHAYNDKGGCLFEDPSPKHPVKHQRLQLPGGQPFEPDESDGPSEVQCEA